MVGLWLSLNVLSFQTSLETWTTAAIINWKKRAAVKGCPGLVRRLSQKRQKKERCSGSYRLAVGFLVIKDESISQRPG